MFRQCLSICSNGINSLYHHTRLPTGDPVMPALRSANCPAVCCVLYNTGRCTALVAGLCKDDTFFYNCSHTTQIYVIEKRRSGKQSVVFWFLWKVIEFKSTSRVSCQLLLQQHWSLAIPLLLGRPGSRWLCGSAQIEIHIWRLVVRLLLIAVHWLRTDICVLYVSSFIANSLYMYTPTHHERPKTVAWHDRNIRTLTNRSLKRTFYSGFLSFC